MGLIVHNVDVPDSGLGDALRTGFVNQNTMNAELYANVVFKVSGYDLSKNDFTDILLAKLNALDENAEPNVKADWNELDPTSDAYILNKPVFESSEIIVSAIWTGTGLIFDVTADAFPINGVSYPATPAQVTLEPADAALDRIDLIVAIKPTFPNTVGTVGKITGTPASTALVVPPDFDPSLYYVIKQVIIRAAATVPEGAVNTIVFNEGIEWDVQTYGSGVVNDSDPSTGSNCIEFFSANSSDGVIFIADTPLSTGDLDLLQFDIKLKEVAVGKYLIIRLRLDGVNIKSLWFNSNEFNGFDDSNLSYQTLSIDKSMINASVSDFDEIQIFLYAPEISGYYLDNVKIYKGSGAETVPNTGIPDAPNDGKLYGRQGLSWAEIVTTLTNNDIEDVITASTADTLTDTSVLPFVKATTLVKITWLNFKAALKGYFDTVYRALFDKYKENLTVTGAFDIDWGFSSHFYVLTGATTWSDINLPTTGTYSETIIIRCTGNFAITYPTGWNDEVTGEYDGTLINDIVVHYYKSGEYKLQITQPD